MAGDISGVNMSYINEWVSPTYSVRCFDSYVLVHVVVRLMSSMVKRRGSL
jgi:hypothetical protein